MPVPCPAAFSVCIALGVSPGGTGETLRPGVGFKRPNCIYEFWYDFGSRSLALEATLLKWAKVNRLLFPAF